jgi:heavy metal sensor kinase
MKPLSFRVRIALLSAGISGLVLLGFGLAGWFKLQQVRTESVDTEIRSLGARHPGWMAGRGNYERLDDALKFIFGDKHENQVILLVKSPAGEVLHTSAGWPPDLDPAKLDVALEDDPNAVTVGSGGGYGRGGSGRGLGPGGGGGQVTFTKKPRFLSVDTSTGPWRLGMLGTADTTLVIGLSLLPARAELNQIRNAFLLAFPAALLMVGFGGWLVARRAVKPMRIIAETAEKVTATGLDQRIPASNADPEIARVIQVLNRMMDRLEASFRQATRFSADASHELKTPLAIMQGELEAALQTAAPGSREQQIFGGLLEETQRLKAITRSLLLLAQADAGQLPLSREPFDLSAALDNLLEDAQILAAESRLKIEVQKPDSVRVQADRALLQAAVMNLLSNGIKYNEPGGHVRVTLTATPAEVTLQFGNSGPAIPPADQGRIFERFHRVDPARDRSVDGLGLGLSLAREIARAHGGEVTLSESKPGWTVFVLRLPRT